MHANGCFGISDGMGHEGSGVEKNRYVRIPISFPRQVDVSSRKNNLNLREGNSF